MSVRRSFSVLWVGCACVVGCGSSYADGTGGDEPIAVSGATFNKGKLPNDGGPALAAASSDNLEAFAGGSEKALSGRANKGAFGVAVRMKNAGSGYWIVPVGQPNLIDVGTLDWGLKFRFTTQAPLGDQLLVVAETDGQSRFGKPTEIGFKVKSLLPDAKKVISLVWNNHADLDLQVQSPAGKLTSAKTPNTEQVPDDGLPDTGIDGSGTLQRDSNARCVFDGMMREDVVFTGDPTPGDYLVWVDLYDSCGEAATTFDLQLHEDGAQTFHIAGRLLDINADNGTGPGLFMHTFSF